MIHNGPRDQGRYDNNYRRGDNSHNHYGQRQGNMPPHHQQWLDNNYNQYGQRQDNMPPHHHQWSNQQPYNNYDYQQSFGTQQHNPYYFNNNFNPYLQNGQNAYNGSDLSNHNRDLCNEIQTPMKSATSTNVRNELNTERPKQVKDVEEVEKNTEVVSSQLENKKILKKRNK